MDHNNRTTGGDQRRIVGLGAAVVAVALLALTIWSTVRSDGEQANDAGAPGSGQVRADADTGAVVEDEQTGQSGDGGTTDAGGTQPAAAAPPSSTGPAASQPEPPLEPHRLPLPDGPAGMIAAIDEAELAVRDPALTNAQLDSWGRRQQSLYRHLSFHPDWAPGVIAGAEPTIGEAVGLNWKARQNLSALVDTEVRHDALPAWRVVAPLPPQTLLGYYKQAEADHGIAWEFLAAINLVETRMGRIEGISTAGAIGPMQFLPTTWAECCAGDPAVPADAIAGAAKYLTIRGGPENMRRAIFGYNNSDYYVDAVTAYATVMMADERAYYGYHAWEIYFLTTEGLIRLPVGYEQPEPIAADAWLRQHPETLFTSGPVD